MSGKPVESENLELGMERGEGGEEPSSSPSTEQPGFVGLKKYQRIHQTAVGAIEIAIGIFMALTAMTYLAVQIDFVIVAIIYWGIFIYIPAGALTITGVKRLTKALMWATLGMNLLVALSAVVGSVLHFYASVLFVYRSCSGHCTLLRNNELVMLALSIVLFIISILASVFAVVALCSTRKQLK